MRKQAGGQPKRGLINGEGANGYSRQLEGMSDYEIIEEIEANLAALEQAIAAAIGTSEAPHHKVLSYKLEALKISIAAIEEN